jgi:hypothetical protein
LKPAGEPDQCRNVQVGNHYAPETFPDEFPEWIQFNLVKSFNRMIDYRQILVRIDIRIPMTGKMFGTGKDA